MRLEDIFESDEEDLPPKSVKDFKARVEDFMQNKDFRGFVKSIKTKEDFEKFAKKFSKEASSGMTDKEAKYAADNLFGQLEPQSDQ